MEGEKKERWDLQSRYPWELVLTLSIKQRAYAPEASLEGVRLDRLYLEENDDQTFESYGCFWKILVLPYNCRLEPCWILKTTTSYAVIVSLSAMIVESERPRHSW